MARFPGVLTASVEMFKQIVSLSIVYINKGLLVKSFGVSLSTFLLLFSVNCTYGLKEQAKRPPELFILIWEQDNHV